MPIKICIPFLLLWTVAPLHAQGDVSFDDLVKKLDDRAIPTYYWKDKLYSGTTVDSFHQGEKVYYYEILAGKIQHHKAYTYSGQLVRDFNYKEGLLHGKITSYFNDGQKYYEDHYRRGRREGRQFGWYKDGSPRYVIDCMGGAEIRRMDYPKPDSLVNPSSKKDHQ